MNSNALWTVVCAAVIQLSPWQSAHAQTPRTPPLDSAPMLVEAAYGDQVFASCGFFLDDLGTFVTVYHGIAGARNVWLNLGAAGVAEFREVVAEHPEFDIVLLRTKSGKSIGSPYRLSPLTPAEGDPCTVFSITQAGQVVHRPCDFVDQDAFRDTYRRRIACTLSKGESGSPVANAEGDVIGMAATVSPMGQSSLIGAPAILRTVVLAASTTPIPLGSWLAAQQGAIRAAMEKVRAAITKSGENRPDEAAVLFREACELAPNNLHILGIMKEFLDRQRKDEDVLAFLDGLTKRWPEERVVRLWKAEVLCRLNRLVEAETQAREAHRLRKTVASSLWLGHILMSQDRHKEAAEVVIEANQMYPYDFGPIAMMEWLGLRTSNAEITRSVREQGNAACPTNIRRLFDLCRLEARFGSQEELEKVHSVLKARNPTTANRLRMLLKGSQSLQVRETEPAAP